MAGFDFHVPVHPEERPFAVLLLKELQRLARIRICERPTEVRFNWHYPNKSHAYHRYTVSVTGDFAEIQAFAFEALHSLQHFSRGYYAGKPGFRLSYLPAVVPISLIKSITEISDMMHEMDAHVSALNLGAKSQANNYMFRRTGCADVDRVLAATRNVLFQWRSGFITGPTLAEQIHTACEISLKAALGEPGSEGAFAAHVAEAAKRGIVDSRQKDALLELKSARRNAKHRGHGIKPARLSRLVQVCVGALHTLASKCAARTGEECLKQGQAL